MIQAVLTGDIIHSTKMSEELRNWLLTQIDEALKQWDKDFDTQSETFRGDSFQTLVKTPVNALRIALIQKTFIRSLNPGKIFEIGRIGNKPQKKQMILPLWIFDARIAIGIGHVNIIRDRLASSGGNAFQLSGRLLDKMKNQKQALGINTDDTFNDELEIEVLLLNAIISKTTALQCEVINLKLLGYTEMEIAQRLNIMQSAVNQRSNSGHWNAIDAMLKRFEKIYS